MNPVDSSWMLRAQATTIGSTLRTLVSGQTPLQHSPPGQQLLALSRDLLNPQLVPQQLLPAIQQGVQELKDLITAYHEAGHVLAFYCLTSRDRIRLDHVYFTGRIHASIGEAGLSYTWLGDPAWPDPAQADEVIRAIACVLAGKHSEPRLTGSIQLEGSDLDDQRAVAELIRLLPDSEQHDAEQRAIALLEGALETAQLSALASQLYGLWVQRETVIPFATIEAFLLNSPAGVQ